MSDRENKKLLKKIDFLEKQNNKLKKELAKYRKDVNKAADLILDSYNKCQIDEDYYEKPDKPKFCVNCGKGEVKTIKVLNFSFEVCPLCQFRQKVK